MSSDVEVPSELAQEGAKSAVNEPLRLGPGAINYMTDGPFIDCRLAFFPGVAGVNAFFEQHRGLVVAKMFYASGGICILYTSQLDEQQRDFLSEWDRKFRDAWLKWKAERDAGILAEKKLKDEQSAEEKRLADVGRKHETYLKALTEENRKLKDDLQRLKKKVKSGD